MYFSLATSFGTLLCRCGVSGYCGLTICLQTYGNVTFYLDPLSGRCSNVPPSALASALHE
eukprot:m.529064 g.529064  ORF g.529064 m.529064 type:complete len:60 (+) comp57563_c0_seq28:1260-1439(+)